MGALAGPRPPALPRATCYDFYTAGALYKLPAPLIVSHPCIGSCARPRELMRLASCVLTVHHALRIQQWHTASLHLPQGRRGRHQQRKPASQAHRARLGRLSRSARHAGHNSPGTCYPRPALGRSRISVGGQAPHGVRGCSSQQLMATIRRAGSLYWRSESDGLSRVATFASAAPHASRTRGCSR